MTSTLTLKDVVNMLADALMERMGERDESLVSQRDPRGLMGRRHAEMVKRRRAEKKGGAYIVGRDYLLTPAALREELERLAGEPERAAPAAPPRPPRKASRSAEHDELARLKRELEADMRAASRR